MGLSQLNFVLNFENRFTANLTCPTVRCQLLHAHRDHVYEPSTYEYCAAVSRGGRGSVNPFVLSPAPPPHWRWGFFMAFRQLSVD